MKKLLSVVLLFAIVLSLSACAKPNEKTVFDLIRESPAAKLELPDGTEIIVDSEIAVLQSFADLRLRESPLEPADNENDWLYRITFNPSEKVQGAEEIVVSIHEDYVQIGEEFYTPEEGVGMESVVDWAEGKMEYFGG